MGDSRDRDRLREIGADRNVDRVTGPGGLVK